MARPKIDQDEVRFRLLNEAEKLLSETNGRRLVLSEIADRIGFSQPYIHKFFATKSDLVRALARRWFDAVENVSANALTADAPVPERLEMWLLGMLRIKRDRYDADPALFDAYMHLAADHPDLISAHTDRLRQDLTQILSDCVPSAELAATVELVEDATALFRIPQNIARYRASVTDRRARAVLELIKPRLP
ncbi:MAG: hypothetical protein CSA72_11140 [Rhodobacterales bacterium]|nr:MAG: hypothetical protein CSA72_11140 [Rhodobacterales bacterium]